MNYPLFRQSFYGEGTKNGFLANNFSKMKSVIDFELTYITTNVSYYNIWLLLNSRMNICRKATDQNHDDYLFQLHLHVIQLLQKITPILYNHLQPPLHRHVTTKYVRATQTYVG